MSRVIKTQCQFCNGRGTVEAEVECFNHPLDYYGYYEIRRVSCSSCRGRGFNTREVDDHIKCVCGMRFESIEALAAHRRSHA